MADGPEWWQYATCDEWLEAAKSAVLDQASNSMTALTCATIALTEALNRRTGDA